MEGTGRGGAAGRWAAPLVLALAFAGLTAWSWERWADVVIDFGAELYVPWRLVEGDVLYRDVAYRHGPLSPYLNALWFELFGVSLRTLVLCNLALLAAFCALCFRLLRRACDRLTASVACLVLLGLFGFSQYLPVANYNWVTPYQHAQTHGVALGVALLAALAQLLVTRRALASALAGALFGLVLLTKLELQLPAFAACVLAAGLAAASGGLRRAWLRLAAVFAVSALLPLATASLLLLLCGGTQAAAGLLGNWRAFGDPLASRFYRVAAGLEDPVGNAALALRACAGIALFAGLAAAIDVALRRVPRRGVLALGIGAGTALLLASGAALRVPWPQLARALPVTSALGLLLFGALALRHAREPRALARWAPLALLAVYALALLAKLGLHATFHHFGFALALPATVLLVVALVGLLPDLLRQRTGGGEIARAMLLAAIAVGMLFFLQKSEARYAAKTLPVGRAADRMLADPERGRALATALERLEPLLPAQATLLVLPEGAGLNYWLRRRSPSRYILFLPTEFAAYGGEDVLLADLRAHPPDVVALVQRPHAEFGVGPFGSDPRNGLAIREWLDAHYRRFDQIGAEPFRGEGFGIVLLRRATP